MRLIVGSVAIGLLELPFDWGREPAQYRGFAIIGYLVGFLIGGALVAGFVFGLRRGRNWYALLISY